MSEIPKRSLGDLGWFVAICDWEFDHLDEHFNAYIWQAIAARLLGLDR